LPDDLANIRALTSLPVRLVWNLGVAAVVIGLCAALWCSVAPSTVPTGIGGTAGRVGTAASGVPIVSALSTEMWLLSFHYLVAMGCLGVALLLRHTPKENAVSILLSFAFLALASIVVPLDAHWLDQPRQVAAAVFGTLFIVAVPAFPDGRYVPRFSKIVLLAGPILGVLSLLESEWALPIGAVLLIVLMSCIGAFVHRFRRTDEPLLRQQLKWAAIGVGAGPSLVVFGLIVIAASDGKAGPAWDMVVALGVVMVVAGTLLLPGGLILSLACYRLNDADAVLSRVSGYTIIAILIAIAWAVAAAASSTVITGSLSKGGAIAINGILAAAVFAPSKERVLKLTERRFQRALVELRALGERLFVWQHDDDPEELANAVLPSAAEGIRAKWVALELADGELVGVFPLDAPWREQSGTVAVRSADAPSPTKKIPLLAGTKEAGSLLVGPRSDGWSYSKAESNALEAISDPLGCALYVTSRRQRRAREAEAAIADLKVALSNLAERVPPPGTR
jgi:hypothetical protein